MSKDVMRLLEDLPRGASLDGIGLRADHLRQDITIIGIEFST